MLTPKTINATVELHTRVSAKGNEYQVLVVKVPMPDKSIYEYETFLDKSELMLFKMSA